MRAGTLGGVPLRIHGLTMPVLLLSCWLSGGRETAVLAVSVLLHEGGHVLMARLLRVRVLELEVMPLGGAARLESVWGLRSGQLIATALAGPAVNALLVVLSVAAASLGAGGLRMVVRINAALLAFNLLPALPMDGGRIVCGLLARCMTPVQAARWGVRLGFMVSALLLMMGARTLLEGPFNLTLPLAALFILAGGPREVRQASGAAMESLVLRRGELEREGVLPARLMAVTPETALSAALWPVTPRRAHIYVCLDERLRAQGWLTDGQLLEALIERGDGPVGNLLTKK